MIKIQFCKSVVVAAISMMAAGGAFASPPAEGNTLRGPSVDAGSAMVKIEQVGSNTIGGTSASTTDTAVVNTGSEELALTVQQIGTTTADAADGNNKIGLKSYSGQATIGIYQGIDGFDGPDSILNAATDNTADIAIGTSSANASAGAVTLLVTQQSKGNYANVALVEGFSGTLKVVQMGSSSVLAPTAPVALIGTANAGNWANLNLLGAAGAVYTIGQNGTNNRVKLTSASAGNVNVNIGEVQTFVANATAGPQANNTNAFDFIFAPGSTGVTAAASGGISLGATSGFNLNASGSGNNVQVDLANAATNSKVGVNLFNDDNTLALYSAGGEINMGGTNGVTLIYGDLTLAAYAGTVGSTVAVNDVLFQGNGFFSATAGSDINVTGGVVNSAGMSILQTGAAHQATIVGTNGSAAWNITQSGTGVDTARLTNTAEDANWTVAQSGAGTMMLEMINATQGGGINVSQSGTANQSATGINFTAALNSTFTLAQR